MGMVIFHQREDIIPCFIFRFALSFVLLQEFIGSIYLLDLFSFSPFSFYLFLCGSGNTFMQSNYIIDSKS